MKYFVKRLLCWSLLFWSFGLSAQTGAVAAFDSGYVETGNPFVLHLKVAGEYGQPERVDWSAWDTLLPQKNILKQSGWQLQNGLWVNDITWITFDSAQWEFPPLRIFFAGGDEVQTNALQLKVLPTPAPDELVDLREIKDIYLEPSNWRDYLEPLWPLALGLIILALAIWRFLYWPKKRGLRGERHIQQPPHTLALLKLAELERQQHWQQGRLKMYYSELSHIAREYLERRYQIPALESPTDEILRQIVHTELPEDLLNPLAEFLRWADMAKFAKGSPPAHFHQEAFEGVHRLIIETQVPEKLPQTEASNTN